MWQGARKRRGDGGGRRRKKKGKESKAIEEGGRVGGKVSFTLIEDRERKRERERERGGGVKGGYRPCLATRSVFLVWLRR